MIFGKNSVFKDDLPAKHPTFSHQVMANTAHYQTLETDLKRVATAGNDPPHKIEDSELVETRS